MPTRLPKSGTDINVWGLTLNDCLRVIGQENIIVAANSDNPPTIKSGTKFLVYKEFSYLIPDSTPTENNVYPADTTIDTPVSEAIFLESDVTFNWSSGGLPAKANSKTYYTLCTGGEDTDETSIGKGIFDVMTSTETTVAYDASKGGYYDTNGYRAILTFNTSSTGTVTNIKAIVPLMPNHQFAIFQDQKTKSTAGGTFTSGAWRTRVLNTTIFNNIFGCSLLSNQITLPAGTYKIKGSAPAYYVEGNQTKIYNITDGADILYGTSQFAFIGLGPPEPRSFVNGVFTISATKVIEFQHYCITTYETNGLGYPSNITTEVYAEIEIQKLY